MIRMATDKQSEFTLEAERTSTQPPPLYKVLLLNDCLLYTSDAADE